uniref:Uncharacterized protein n=1 Tax=Nelumbo nucifera TaxID=4432 RepID=A0A822ZL19_NELNU|nr:TPA_asm: hypothetical protein HUJ06_000678 [Nelumbo nucifera]
MHTKPSHFVTNLSEAKLFTLIIVEGFCKNLGLETTNLILIPRASHYRENNLTVVLERSNLNRKPSSKN